MSYNDKVEFLNRVISINSIETDKNLRIMDVCCMFFE